jgi:hypothetical protein
VLSEISEAPCRVHFYGRADIKVATDRVAHCVLPVVIRTLNHRTQQDGKDLRLEQARKGLLVALDALRSAGTLTVKEADAVEAAIEDELIALRVGPFFTKRD